MKPGPAVAGLVAALVAIGVLREATQSRHEVMGADTVMELVVQGSSNQPRANLAPRMAALFLHCELEVATDPLGPPERLDDRTFLLRVQPALDETDRRQMAGCLEDAKLDRFQAKVLAIRQVPDEPRPGR